MVDQVAGLPQEGTLAQLPAAIDEDRAGHVLDGCQFSRPANEHFRRNPGFTDEGLDIGKGQGQGQQLIVAVVLFKMRQVQGQDPVQDQDVLHIHVSLHKSGQFAPIRKGQGGVEEKEGPLFFGYTELGYFIDDALRRVAAPEEDDIQPIVVGAAAKDGKRMVEPGRILFELVSGACAGAKRIRSLCCQ